jgi:uncharacterized protein (DUF1810 family)
MHTPDTLRAHVIAPLGKRKWMSDRMMDADRPDLQRFLDAQKHVYDRALRELAAGKKVSHWMWFVFPQLAGLGSSPTANRYAVKSSGEAGAYLDHAILGPRLRECTKSVLGVKNRSAAQIFGYPDDLKFCSSMTLFEQVAEDATLFGLALARFYGGTRDARTLSLLG